MDNEDDCAFNARQRLNLSDLARRCADLARVVGDEDLARRADELADRIYEN